jgi:hypothetical protein
MKMKTIVIGMVLLGSVTFCYGDEQKPGANNVAKDAEVFDAIQDRPQNIQNGTFKRGEIYSKAAPASLDIPRELRNFKIEVLIPSPENIVNCESFGFDVSLWHGDSSRIIWLEGKYHVWMIDGYNHYRDKISWVLYLTSEDCQNWTAVGRLPLGPTGSAYDVAIEQPNVVYHNKKFYLFSEGWTSNVKKYGTRFPGIICLQADRPEGPWTQVGDILLAPEKDNGMSWDSDRLMNPRHVYFKGKWYMYYKARGSKEQDWNDTENGVAIADDITGPYKKYEGNPLVAGHGHFAFTYKNGVVYIPFAPSRVLWSEDGVTFSENLLEIENQVPFCGSVYISGNSLFGEGIPPNHPANNSYYGFINRKGNVNGKKVNKMDTIRWSFGDHP